MYLNTIKPAKGAKKVSKRLGRGIGSGKGKTSGKGHKGQRARAGGYHKVGFEGGQMPLQRRLPKFGFTSRMAKTSQEIRLSTLERLEAAEINFNVLQEKKLLKAGVTKVKVILDEPIKKAVTVVGLKVTAGAKKAIESVGGKVVEG